MFEIVSYDWCAYKGYKQVKVGDLVRYDGNKIGLLLDKRYNTALIYTMNGTRMKLYLPLVKLWAKNEDR